MKKYLTISIVLASILSSCSNLEEKKAKVIDSEVQGLEYQCAGLVNYTNRDGELTCTHMPLAFKIGELRLGLIYKMPNDGLILPQDIVGADRSDITNKDVIKLSIILQTLDSDKNPNNGITISKESSNKLKLPIELKKVSLSELKELLQTQLGDIEFREPKKSIYHLNSTMQRFNISEANSNLEDLDLDTIDY